MLKCCIGCRPSWSIDQIRYRLLIYNIYRYLYIYTTDNQGRLTSCQGTPSAILLIASCTVAALYPSVPSRAPATSQILEKLKFHFKSSCTCHLHMSFAVWEVQTPCMHIWNWHAHATTCRHVLLFWYKAARMFTDQKQTGYPSMTWRHTPLRHAEITPTQHILWV